MASQRVTIAKVGGVAADVVGHRLRQWAAARFVDEPETWASDQWPPPVRTQVDHFADQLRVHGCSLPVVHYVEWSDLWSMGDILAKWLAPPGGSSPLITYGDRFEVHGYALPDGGRLARYLAAGPQQFPEYDQFVGRLREAVGAWDGLVDQALLIVLREVVGGLVTDEELTAAMSLVPSWICGSGQFNEAIQRTPADAAGR